MRSLLGWTIVALVAACAEQTTASRVLTPIERGPLEYRGYFYGELHARNSVAIHTPELSSVHKATVHQVLEDGTVVKKDDIVLSFVRDEVEDELRAKESDLAVARASLRREAENLERERIDLELMVERQRLLVEKARLFVVEGVNFISKVELEKAKLDVSRAELELANAKKKLQSFSRKKAAALKVSSLKVETAADEVERRQKDLEKMDVRAPADGMVYAPYTRLNWVRGKAMQGSVSRPGDKLLELPDLSSFDLHVAVRQKDVKLIEVGDKAVVYPAADPEQPITAEVTSKESFATTRNERLGTSSVEGNLKEVTVVVQLASAPSYLRPGGSARVEIQARRGDDVLRVPLAALREVEDGYAVELENGELKAVEVGRVTNAFAEVVDGVVEGDKVALVP